jgi:hypothetical protein
MLAIFVPFSVEQVSSLDKQVTRCLQLWQKLKLNSVELNVPETEFSWH